MVTPTSTTETTGPLAGMLVFTDNTEIIRTGLAAAVIVVIGKAVTFDAAGRAIPAIATSNNADGIGIATINPNSPIGSQTGTIDNTSGAADALFVQVAVGNTYCFSKANGAIKPLSLIKVDATSQWIAHTKPANAT